MTFRALITIACVSALMAAGTSCRPQPSGKLAELQPIYLNQCLLRDATEGMSRIWNTRVELDSDVSSLSGLWIDYAPKKEVTLSEALDDILQFVHTEHHVRLRWSASADHIRISKR